MKAEDVKLGQKLRVLNTYPEKWDSKTSPRRGTIGTVTNVFILNRPGLSFENFAYGHTADSTADAGHGWFIEVEYLEPTATLDYVSCSEQPLFPSDAKLRKEIPLASGVLDYFPAALIEVAKVSFAGNQQHNPGQPLHWARAKSTDQSDTIVRHFMERGKMDEDGVRHSAKLAWRALALLQLELEAEGAPMARGAKA